MQFLNPARMGLKSRETLKGGSLALTVAVCFGHLAKGLGVVLPVVFVWPMVEEALKSFGVQTGLVAVFLECATVGSLFCALCALLAFLLSERQSAKTVSPVPLRVDGKPISSFLRPPTRPRHRF